MTLSQPFQVSTKEEENMSKRTQFERLVTQKAMDFVSNAQNEKLADFMIESGQVDRHMKNLCTKVSIPLSDEIDNLCSILDISKRKFCEAAFIEAIEKAQAIMREEGVFAVFDEDLPEEARDVILDQAREAREQRELFEELEKENAQ